MFSVESLTVEMWLHCASEAWTWCVEQLLSFISVLCLSAPCIRGRYEDMTAQTDSFYFAFLEVRIKLRVGPNNENRFEKWRIQSKIISWRVLKLKPRCKNGNFSKCLRLIFIKMVSLNLKQKTNRSTCTGGTKLKEKTKVPDRSFNKSHIQLTGPENVLLEVWKT